MSHPDPTFEPPELDELLQSAWQAMASGIADAAHGWHQAAISSLGADGGPDLRTVVVRSADPDQRTIGFHTDARSEKIDRFAADPRVGVLLYDRALRIQLRATGVASVHRDDALADAAWGRSSLSSRRCYLAPEAPSSALEAFSPNLPPDLLHRRPELEVSEGGRRHFALVLCRMDRMEWLHLRHDGHVRARFEWAPDGSMTATWLAP